MRNKILIATLLALVLISCTSAYPKLTKYVTDNADLLSNVEEQQLTQLIDNVETSTGYEIAVLTVTDTDGEDRINFASRSGEESGIGKKELDNGVVIMWSLDDEQGGAIATGRGAESVLTDAQVSRIGRASRNYFDNKEYYKGFEFIITEIGGLVDADTIGTHKQATDPDSITELWQAVIIIGVIVLFLFIFGGGGLPLLWIIGGSGSSGGGRGGGGSFGGGGSRF
jgi:uncharacterized protein